MFISSRSQPENEENENNVAWQDAYMLALLGFVAIVFLLLPFLNEPSKKSKDDIIPPGSVIIEIFWRDDVDVDVDLWVQAPGDVSVGYSNKGGVIFNLLRDDLGTQADVTNRNAEIAYSRGIVPGEYTVNLHLYRNAPQIFPILVKTVLSIKPPESSAAIQHFSRDVSLHYDGEEVTAFRFSLTAEGTLIAGSVHRLFRPLRSATFSPPTGNSLDNR